MQIKKAFLIFSFVAVSIFALLYGISPRWYAGTFLGITDLNLKHCPYLEGPRGPLCSSGSVLALRGLP